MKLWLTSFIVLLALVESSKWLQHIALPLPAIVLGGALLAVISNSTVLFAPSTLSQLQVSTLIKSINTFMDEQTKALKS
ncbi:MAG: hypothetical protein WA902_02635 [Thermosynechococcaceae cyanobacterium]